jgi:hypothetical protein
MPRVAQQPPAARPCPPRVCARAVAQRRCCVWGSPVSLMARVWGPSARRLPPQPPRRDVGASCPKTRHVPHIPLTSLSLAIAAVWVHARPELPSISPSIVELRPPSSPSLPPPCFSICRGVCSARRILVLMAWPLCVAWPRRMVRPPAHGAALGAWPRCSAWPRRDAACPWRATPAIGVARGARLARPAVWSSVGVPLARGRSSAGVPLARGRSSAGDPRPWCPWCASLRARSAPTRVRRARLPLDAPVYPLPPCTSCTVRMFFF